MPRTLTPEQARSIAFAWMTPLTPLHRFAVAGTMQNRDELLAQIHAQVPSTAEDQRDLIRLYNYILTQLEHRPADAYPWRAPWAKEVS